MIVEKDVAVVGGGVIGTSIAAWLTQHGVDTVLLDNGLCGGQGATAFSGGVVRLYDPDPVLMALAAHSLQCLKGNAAGEAFACHLNRTGLLHRVSTSQSTGVHDALDRHRHGLYPLCLVDDAQVASMSPLADPAAGRLNLFEPLAAVGDARGAARALAALVQKGNLLLEHTEVESVEVRSNDQVHLKAGPLQVRVRVCVIAGGGWTARLIPGIPLQTRSIPLARVKVSRDTPLPIIDATAGAYAVPVGGGIVLAGSGVRHAATVPSELPPVGAPQAQDVLARLSRLSGRQEQGPVFKVLPGFDAYTPDGRPLVGFPGKDSPVYLATGLSGLGFKFAPAIGEIASSQIRQRLRGMPADDIWPVLSPSRLSDAAAPAQPAGVQP